MTENELLKKLIILGCRRAVRPSLQDSAEMTKTFNELYELTKNELYKL